MTGTRRTATPADRVESNGPARRRRRLTTAALAALAPAALLVGACAGESPAVASDDPELQRGRALYIRNCVNCHGSAGQGGIGNSLVDPPVAEVYPDPAAQIAVVASGVESMPGFEGKLSEDDLAAVVRYTREALG